MKLLFDNTENQVIYNSSISESFRTNEGGALSPLLFIVYMDKIAEMCEQNTRAVHVGYYNMRPVAIRGCLFADDLALFAEEGNTLKQNLNTYMERKTESTE